MLLESKWTILNLWIPLLDISCATGGMKYHNLLISLYIRPWESNEDNPRDVIMTFPHPFHYEGRKKRWSHLLTVQYKWLTATHPTTAYNRYKKTSMTLCFQELLSSPKFPMEDSFCGLQLIELILQKRNNCPMHNPPKDDCSG